jgi:hypothetical protein
MCCPLGAYSSRVAGTLHGRDQRRQWVIQEPLVAVAACSRSAPPPAPVDPAVAKVPSAKEIFEMRETAVALALRARDRSALFPRIVVEET